MIDIYCNELLFTTLSDHRFKRGTRLVIGSKWLGERGEERSQNVYVHFAKKFTTLMSLQKVVPFS